LERVVDGVEGFILGALEFEIVLSLLGLADLLADFYFISKESDIGIITGRLDIRNPISRASHSWRSYY
jgi:hypothetical protein